MSEVVVDRLEPLGMIVLRGDPETLGAATREILALDVPDARMSRADARGRLVWMSPDELLFVGAYDEVPDIALRLREALGDAFATVAVVSDARAAFDLTGGDPRDVLAKLMPVDFGAMAEAEVRRSRMAQVAAACWREGAAWRVVCFRSVADYAEALLRNAAATPPPGLYRG